MDRVDLALRLTLLTLLLQPVGTWWIRASTLVLAASALLFPSLLRRPWLWLALALLTGARVVLDWPLPDNHAYLLAYWCLAIGLALVALDPDADLAFNGRLLIGLVFAFAALWKVALSPDFMDGSFFQVLLMTDPRFEPLALTVGGLSPELLEQNRELLRAHIDGPAQLSAPGVVVPAALSTFARTATLGTAGLEVAIALAFLAPLPGSSARVRDALLLAFCVATYAFAQVEGFGWLLIAMAVAQCAPERTTTRALYLGTFALILLYREIPWSRFV
jgi:hypothetical protein